VQPECAAAVLRSVTDASMFCFHGVQVENLSRRESILSFVAFACSASASDIFLWAAVGRLGASASSESL
jgi:hypothetical protein